MTSLLLLVAGLAACDAGLPAPTPTTPPPAPLPAPVVVASPMVSADGQDYAIVQLRGFRSELCTNMGGMVWWFSVEGMPADYRLRGGGHGIFGTGSTLPGIETEAAADLSWRDRYYVAEVTLPTRGRLEHHAPCDPDHSLYDGTVLAVAPARDLDDARAQLAAAPGRGLPAAVRIDHLGR